MGEVLQSRRWLLDIISSIINVRQPNGESKTSQSEANQSAETSSEIVEIWAKPLRLLITSSLFVVPEKLSKKCKIHELKQILELAEIEDEQLADINNQIQNIINVNRNAYLKYAFEFAKECATQKGVQLRNPFEDVAQVRKNPKPIKIWPKFCLIFDPISFSSENQFLAVQNFYT